MALRFKEWSNQYDEAGFLSGVNQFAQGMMQGITQGKPTDADFNKAADEFIKFLQSEHNVKWNKADLFAKKNLTNVVKSLALNQIIPDKTLIDLTNSINKVNQHQFNPRELIGLYVQAHDLNPKIYRFPPGVHDPQVINNTLDDNWEQHRQVPTPPKTHTPHASSKDKAEHQFIIDGFEKRARWKPKDKAIRDLLSIFIISLYLRKSAPWQSMLKKLYATYRAEMGAMGGRPESALDFVQHLTHHYDIGNNAIVEQEAQRIDDEIAKGATPTGPAPPPAPGTMTPKEAIINKYIVHIAKRYIDPKAPRGTMMTIDDWRALPKGSPEWMTVLRAVASQFKKPAQIAEFTAATS